jgi:hypothetical protein
MNDDTAREIFDHMFSLLETLETESTATLQLLRAKDIVTDEELAPYLDQAGNASSVRWRAARARIEYLLSSGKIGQAASEKKEPEKEQPEKERQKAAKVSEWKEQQPKSQKTQAQQAKNAEAAPARSPETKPVKQAENAPTADKSPDAITAASPTQQDSGVQKKSQAQSRG